MKSMLMQLTALTLQSPKEGAVAVLAQNYSREMLWALLVLATVLTVLLVQAMRFAFPQPPEMETMLPFQNSPILFALIMWGSLVLMVFCVQYIGQAFGGTGSFTGSLTLVIWMQYLLMVSQVVQFGLALLSVVLAGLLGLVFIVYWFWIFATFLAQLHGFANRVAVLGGVFASMIGLMLGFSLLTTLIAIMFGVEIPNA